MNGLKRGTLGGSKRRKTGWRKSIPEALETRQAEIVSNRDGPGIPLGARNRKLGWAAI